jgi:hypothetical protein
MNFDRRHERKITELVQKGMNTIPIRNLSHRIKNGNRENRQPVEPKSVKQHKATKIKLKKICGGQLSRSRK